MRRICGIILALLAVCTASSAFAHATLLTSDPADGSVLSAAPSQFTLTFNEPVSPVAIRLVASDGTASDLPGVEPHDETVSVPLPPLDIGAHALSWRVVSADGHPVGGSVVFSIGALSSMAVSQASHAPVERQVAIWFARFVLYLGLFVGVGGAFFGAWVAREPLSATPQRAVACTLLAVPVVATVSLALQGLDLLDVPIGSLLTGAPWVAAALGTTYAWTLAIAIVAALLAWTRARWATAVALVAVGLALASSGHASDAQPQYITRPAVFIHAMAVTFWIGALVPLAANTSTVTLRRFSRIVPLPIALLIVSGVTLAAIQIGSPAAIAATAYGRLFAAKMVLVVVLLAIAAWNRWQLTPGAAHKALARSIMVELVLVAAVLGVVAGWRFTPPPRALAVAAAAAEPLRVHIHSEKAMADVSIAPGKPGPVNVSIAIQDGDFGPLEAKAVTLSLSNPEAGIEPIRREASHLDGALWRVNGLTLPARGTWQVKVDILLTEFSQVTLQAPLTVP